MEWQTIETAPLDGRELLITDGETIKVARRKLFPRPIHSKDGTIEDMSVSKAGDSWEYFRDDKNAPGHTWSIGAHYWMPLPELPPDSARVEGQTNEN